MGILPDGVRLFDRLTGEQLVSYAGLLRGMDKDVVAARVSGTARRPGPGPRRRHAGGGLLRRHDQEDRPRLGADPRAPAAGAGRAVRVRGPGLGRQHPRHPGPVRGVRRHRHRLQPRDGPRPADVRPRRRRRRRAACSPPGRWTRSARASPSKTASSSWSAAATTRRGWNGCAPSKAQADPAAQQRPAQPVAAGGPRHRHPVCAGARGARHHGAAVPPRGGRRRGADGRGAGRCRGAAGLGRRSGRGRGRGHDPGPGTVHHLRRADAAAADRAGPRRADRHPGHGDRPGGTGHRRDLVPEPARRGGRPGRGGPRRAELHCAVQSGHHRHRGAGEFPPVQGRQRRDLPDSAGPDGPDRGGCRRGDCGLRGLPDRAGPDAVLDPGRCRVVPRRRTCRGELRRRGASSS